MALLLLLLCTDHIHLFIDVARIFISIVSKSELSMFFSS